MAKKLFVNIETLDTEVSFTIDKDKLMFPEIGLMYTIIKATDPKSKKNILIPWHQIKKVVIDETLEDKEDGNK